MNRKKANPNRVPIGPGDYDLEQIKDQATSSMVLQEWAVILAALSNLEGMSTEKLLDFWRKMDQVSTRRLMEHKPKWWKVKSVPILHLYHSFHITLTSLIYSLDIVIGGVA